MHTLSKLNEWIKHTLSKFLGQCTPTFIQKNDGLHIKKENIRILKSFHSCQNAQLAVFQTPAFVLRKYNNQDTENDGTILISLDAI